MAFTRYNRRIMELPVLKSVAGRASGESLVRSAQRAESILTRLLAEELQLDAATAHLSSRHPLLPEANAATEMQATDAASAEALVSAVERRFTDAGGVCRRWECNDEASAAWMTPVLMRRGLRAVTRQVMLLERWRQTPPARQDVQVIPARAAYAQVGAVTQRIAVERGATAQVAGQRGKAIIDLLDEARLDLFLARIGREPLGTAGVLTLGNVGVLTQWGVMRHEDAQDVWRTLAWAVLDHCQRAKFEQVVVALDEGDPETDRFESIGFVKAARWRTFLRDAE